MSAFINNGRSITQENDELTVRLRPEADASCEGILITIKVILKKNLKELEVGLKGTEGVTMDSHTPLPYQGLARIVFTRTACRS